MIKDLVDNHFHSFNAGELKRSCQALDLHLKSDGKLVVTIAGGLSSAGIGTSLAPLIKDDKVQCIISTGANIEEDIFKLLWSHEYLAVKDWRDLNKTEDTELYEKGFNRITDTCIPERVFEKVGLHMTQIWKDLEEPVFHYETIYKLCEDLVGNVNYSELRDSWVYQAFLKGIPIYTPGWEDSTLGNKFTALCIEKKLEHSIIKTGTAQMSNFVGFYKELSYKNKVGFLQLGGGIAGDFPICVVPLITQDLKQDAPMWSYFCQISESTTSYGSYSGAPPSEKITWGKITKDTPAFMIESDATIVFPIMSQYILGD